MAVTYGFFDSVNGDRKYNADTMSEFYTGICTPGVFQHVNNGLAVSAGTGLTVNVATGRALIQNHWVKNDSVKTLTVSAASATYARIDAVVIRFSKSNRSISILMKDGTAAASPSAPSMTRNSDVYEFALAYVNVAANASSVTVTDKRSDSSVCGWAAVAQATSGEVDQMLNDMKTGFDGVSYDSPVAMVQGCDALIDNEVNKLADVPGDNIIELTDFTEPGGTPDTSATVDSVNNTITVTNTATAAYACMQTSLGYIGRKLAQGRTYRLHAKAEVLSGSAQIVVGIRGTDGGEYTIAQTFSIYDGGESFIDFEVNQYMSRICLFVTFDTPGKASVKFSELWLKEYNTTGINQEIDDSVDDLKKRISDVWYPYEKTSEWDQGAIVNGKEESNSTRIRTGFFFLPKGATLIINTGAVEDAHELNYYAIIYYNSAKIYQNATTWSTGYHEETATDDMYIRICARRNDSTTITTSGMNMTIVVSMGTMSKVKVLALGDSICYGARNRLNGFIGKAGCRYKNVAVTGATFSTSQTNNIISQLLNVSGYTPDAIITNGGINDYGEGVQMGTVPVRVIDPNNDNPESMDKTTVMGALQYLFYKMITLYPNAQRFYVMPQHTWDRDRIEGSGGWNFDTFYENVSKVCKMYGVQIVDIYTKSPINTRYSEYRSQASYSYTPPDTEKGWVNYDGVHPLPYGYTHGYTPFVREALQSVVPAE